MISDSELSSHQEPEGNASFNSVYERMIASTAGSVLTSLLVTPFDVVKTRLQIQEGFEKCKKGSNPSVRKTPLEEVRQFEKILGKMNQTAFKGTVDAFIRISSQEGVNSLWSGLTPTLLVSVPANVMYYTIYDQYRELLISSNVVPVCLIPFVAGSAARVISVTLSGPMEFLRTKVQSEKVTYYNAFRTLNNLVKQRGFISLWHGWVPTFYRDILFSAIYWSIYEHLKQQKEQKFIESFSYGAISGTVAATLTLPFDVIKTRRQAELGQKTIVTGLKSPSTLSLMVQLYKRGGVKSLFAGFFPRMLKVGLASAIMISSYEAGKLYFLKHPLTPANKDKNSCEA